ncbi:L domain-like protein [Backusella circina FSU 941]|nr:L domain-like protein [Backusella circina FSU 941]
MVDVVLLYKRLRVGHAYWVDNVLYVKNLTYDMIMVVILTVVVYFVVARHIQTTVVNVIRVNQDIKNSNLSLSYLDNNAISGFLPEVIANSRILESLNLKGNHLLGGIPSFIGNLTSLKSLSLSHQMLNGTIPEQIYSLVNLQYLDLSNNRLTGSISSNIGNLVNLVKLSLGHNGLTGQIPNQIGKLVKLESLNLNYNSLNGQFPSVDAPPALGYCYMTPNQFQSCPDDSVIQNPQSLAYQCSVDCLYSKLKVYVHDIAMLDLLVTIIAYTRTNHLGRQSYLIF